MKVKDAKPGDTIEIMCCGSYDSDSTSYFVTVYQDVESKVRALSYKGYIYLYPENECRLVVEY